MKSQVYKKETCKFPSQHVGLVLLLNGLKRKNKSNCWIIAFLLTLFIINFKIVCSRI